MDKEQDRSDAGLKSLNHYQDKLPRWRYQTRQHLLPLVRWETPYLAWVQHKIRSPALDQYFALTANLGTHTFFMIILPILFWCGFTSLGRGMVHILASGVFFSGFIKDMWCLPRPLSPPIQRITMSGSTALEYGFPSTHSTNAVSVAVYALYHLKYEEPAITTTTNNLLQIISYSYATSIILGRVYCGMHGVFDVLIGGVVGAALSLVQCLYGGLFDTYIHGESVQNVLLVAVIILVLIRIHPEPADDCPCFDDSVAFAGVMIGVEFGNWHYAKTRHAWKSPTLGTVPFDLQSMGWLVATMRIVLGVAIIFAWREMMKPTLLRCLPPLFRIIEKQGLNLPRKFFKQASEYSRIPKHHKDDNVMPSMSDIPALFSSIHRQRAVSIGPQSEADVYETLAYREKRRRASLSSGSSSPGPGPDGLAMSTQSPSTSRLEVYERQMGSGFDTASSKAGAGDVATTIAVSRTEHRKNEEQDMFSRLQKPRVRYDVEVVTKLVVYSGIAWLAVEGNPILFDLAGLGI